MYERYSSYSDDIYSFQYVKYASLVGHENSVTTAVGYQQSSTGDIYLASGSADSTVKIWHVVDTNGLSIESNR